MDCWDDLLEDMELAGLHELYIYKHSKESYKRLAQERRQGKDMDINKQAEMLAFEQAMIYAGYNKPERGPYPDSGYLYERDADRFAGWMLRAEVGADGTAPEGHNAN